jgi:hypothetical protein
MSQWPSGSSWSWHRWCWSRRAARTPPRATRPRSPAEVGFVEFLTPLMDWVERGVAPGPLDAPTLSAADFSLVRDLTIAPVDALRPVHAAPGGLNANYDYVGGY